MERRVRTAAKALIIEDGKLLVTVNRDRVGDFYLLPGGGQEHGETLAEAMRRECLEEIGCEVEVGDIAMVRDYRGAYHEFSDHPQEVSVHQVEIMFACRLAPGAEPCNGPGADRWQTGIAWLPLDRLHEHRIYPKTFARILRNGLDGLPVYLGDIN